MASDEVGTRTFQQFLRTERPSTRFPNNKPTRDPGMKKRVIASATFSGAVLTDLASTFTVFSVGDPVTIFNSAQNNGDRMITAVTATSITCDFPFKTEGPTAGVEIRTL